MMEKTRAIVLHSIKYGESQFIVDFLTESRGRVSFLVKIPKSSKSNSKRQYFQPLTLVTLEFDFRANQNLQRIKNIGILYPYEDIPFSPIKISVSLFLAEFLLSKGYEVHGTIRRSSVDFRERIAHLEGQPHFHLHYADLGDSMSIIQVMNKVRPTEVYNLAAQSHVQVSFDSPEFTADVDATGVLRILEAIRQCGLEKTCRMYQASTSELYGKVEEVPQNENTPFHPYSPYAVAKLYGYWIVKEYREAYNMFCCSGILFNHESERRGETFVTRKITLAAARIAQGKQDKLYLGNLSSLRDWGYAKDYVECMWLILQHDKPEDFVIATGVQHSVRDFCYLAFKHVGIELEFKGEGENEKGIDKKTGKVLIEVSKDFYRPTDVVNLWGDPTKAKAELGWDPGKTSFEQLVKIMVEADMAKVAVERAGEQVKMNLAEYLEKGIVK